MLSSVTLLKLFIYDLICSDWGSGPKGDNVLVILVGFCIVIFYKEIVDITQVLTLAPQA